MDSVLQSLQNIDFSWDVFLMALAVLAVGTILLGAIGRFAFGKRSVLSLSVSSAIGILFVYAITIALHSAGAEFQTYIAPLPFVTFTEDTMYLFSFQGADYTVVCSQLLSMMILVFLANLVESILPKGKKFFPWLLLRCLSIVLAIVAHLAVTYLLTTYLPEGLITYAPVILLGLLVVLLLVGALKLVVGAVLATVNPLIAAFYTFFFATLVGKALTKAMLTTAILSGLIFALNYIGCTAISIASAALVAYIPLLIVLVALWYLVSKF